MAKVTMQWYACMYLLTTFTYSIKLDCMHEQKAHGVWLIGVTKKNAVFAMLWALPNDLKQVFQSFRLIRCAYESLRS
jgi:hypothetical protein